MRPMSRFLLIPAALAVLVVVPFLIWGDRLGGLAVTGDGSPAGDSGHAGLIGIGLLVADLFLPVPTSSVIAGLGIVYGPVAGTVYALAGSLLAAATGYALGRLLGRPFARRWLGPHMAAGERAFARHGGWIVAASRWMPVLPEVVSVSAGVSRMPFAAFMAAALCGALPHTALFAVAGHLGAETPGWTLLVSAVVPLLLWLVVVRTGLARRAGLTPDA